jgi:mannan endo-1,4-beta-mannosidase
MQTPAKSPESAPGVGFELSGQPFCFAGANNYYAIYKPRPMVDDLLDSARALDLRVLRIWGMLDRGSLDGSVPNVDGDGHKDGVYFQYWDVDAKRPAYNDGADGLERLDYVLAAAAQRDLKLVVVLLNNWRAFGGIDQYLTWFGRSAHHEFFSADDTRQAYRDWISHVLNRRNSINGRLYREDPTVLGWELANEPRCKGGGPFDHASGWDTTTLTTWAKEMSDYVKSLDPNHLVSVGDEGFLTGGGENAHWAFRGNDGVDHAALTALPSIDFGTFHLYPEDWQMPSGLPERWIAEHLQLARRLGKPTLLEEYGIKASSGAEARRQAYTSWNDALQAAGAPGLAWMLAGRDERGGRYPDYDGFAFYLDDATGHWLGEWARSAERSCERRSAVGPASPYVSVGKPPSRSANGWVPAP